jgi:hypothetical protein
MISNCSSHPGSAPTRFNGARYRVHLNIDLDTDRRSTHTAEGLDLATPVESVYMSTSHGCDSRPPCTAPELVSGRASLDCKATAESARLKGIRFSPPQRPTANGDYSIKLRNSTGKSLCAMIRNRYFNPSIVLSHTKLDSVSSSIYLDISLDINRMNKYTVEGLDLATPVEPVAMPTPYGFNDWPGTAAPELVSDLTSSPASRDATPPRRILPQTPIVEEADEMEEDSSYSPAY